MGYRKVHPYERKNPERPKEDVVKRFKNLNRAHSIFILYFTFAIIFDLVLYSEFFHDIDLNIFQTLLIIVAIGFILYIPLYKLLNKLFPDPGNGIIITSFIVTAPFLLGILMMINSIISFESPDEKLKIVDYTIEHWAKPRRTVYIIQLENNKYYFQSSFRTSSNKPEAEYIVYQFRRGIMGVRVLDGKYFSD